MQAYKEDCELCDSRAHYKNFPFNVGRRLHTGYLCKRCARQGPDGEMMSETEAIEFLQGIFGEDTAEWDRLESMKGDEFETIE